MFARLKHLVSTHLLLLIVLIGAFLRLYRLPDTMQFMGDQGRDASIARRILIDHRPALIGPVTSVGNMYLGPFYYYFMVIPLLVTYPDPTGPAYAVALLGILTLFLVYKLGRLMLGEKPALFASLLYALSPIIINNVRFSWNPNIVPLFSLLFVHQLYRALLGKKWAWTWAGLIFAILLQLHYITLALAAFAGLVWLYLLFTGWKRKSLTSNFFLSTFFALAIFLLSLTPLVIFDLRHSGQNSKAFTVFFEGGGQHFQLLERLSALFFAWQGICIRVLLEIYNLPLHGLPAIILFFAALIYFGYEATRKDKYQVGKRLLISCYFFSLFILSLYRGSIFDHYLGFAFPLSALMLGIFFSRLQSIKPLSFFSYILLALFLLASLKAYPGVQQLGYNYKMMKQTASEIYTHVSPDDHYDILLFSESHDYQGLNYRYFLETKNNKPATEEEVHSFKKLFVIDEYHSERPFDTPQYKIAIWPNRTIVDEFTIKDGPHVLMLTR